MTTKLVVRILGLSGEIIGWKEVQATARGDGALWASSPIYVPVECAGTPVVISVHWADVNVEVRAPLPGSPVAVGQTIAVPHEENPMIRVGSPPIGLPPVTVRAPQMIAVPACSLGSQAPELKISA